jgi:hypothetical protein
MFYKILKYRLILSKYLSQSFPKGKEIGSDVVF